MLPESRCGNCSRWHTSVGFTEVLRPGRASNIRAGRAWRDNSLHPLRIARIRDTRASEGLVFRGKLYSNGRYNSWNPLFCAKKSKAAGDRRPPEVANAEQAKREKASCILLRRVEKGMLRVLRMRHPYGLKVRPKARARIDKSQISLLLPTAPCWAAVEVQKQRVHAYMSSRIKVMYKKHVVWRH